MAGQPLVLGSTHRSIKDDQAEPSVAPKLETKAAAAIPPSSKPASASVTGRKSAAAPAKKTRRVVARPASGPSAPACEGEAECVAQLKALIDNPDRSWIGQPEPPADHATGTRLFAYRALQNKLTCEELSRAIEEIEAAAAAFTGKPTGIDARTTARVLALNASVETELRAERTRRCSG